ncbi:MAG TPA: alpha/beta hydrolase [Spirochaetota bacterium]|nr:alpha/beta hydrolase [Spirochaetota bacterium]
MRTEEFLFPGTENSSLSARIYSDNTESENGIIFSHGLFSSKDGYKITRLAHDIVSCGYNLMTFNFSSAENFNKNIQNISLLEQVHELGCAVDEFRRRGIRRLHLMGSSMGATISLLYAASATVSVESLVLIATPLNLLAIVPGMTAGKALQLDDSGYFEISGISVNNGFFKEIVQVSMIDAVKKVNCPVLLIHGKKDNVVDFSNFRLFVSNCRTDCTQLVIERGDHNLTADQDLELIRKNIVKWLGRFYA